MGYLVYSLFCHAYYRESPGGLEAFAVVFASVLPDLIDKPLAWEYGVFETGYALGHSVFFAVPLSIAVGILARSSDRPRTGIAFAMGYLLHLPADIVDGYVRGGHLSYWIVLWPVRTGEELSHGHSHGFTDQLSVFLTYYRHELFSGDPSTYILLQVGMAVFVLVLWLYDGAPVLRECLLGGKRLLELSIDRTVEYRER